MHQVEVDAVQLGSGGLRGDRPIERVTGLQDDGVVGFHAEGRRDVRVPAIVPGVRLIP
jgi:hypothetical protein